MEEEGRRGREKWMEGERGESERLGWHSDMVDSHYVCNTM